MIASRRYQRAASDDRFVVVSVEPSAGRAGYWLIRVARGPAPGKLVHGKVYGPFAAEELEARFADVDRALVTEGFGPAVHESAIAALSSADPAKRARAAIGLGWRRDPAAVPALLAALESAGAEVTSIVDALGRIGDPRGVPAARTLAGKKLLSRRRSGIEALRNLGDLEGLAAAREAGRARLPEAVLAALDAADPDSRARTNVAPLVAAIAAAPMKQRALAADQLYEIGGVAATAAALRALAELPMGAPHVWRYAKSIWKRSMLRDDPEAFGVLAAGIERAALVTTGTTASVKSGLDGKTRPVLIFGQRTRRWASRASWRHLRMLARWRPDRYAPTAASFLSRVRPDDAGDPVGLAGPWANAYVLHRILRGRSERFRLDDRRLRFFFVSAAAAATAPTLREESFPELWDAVPRAYLPILVRGRTPEVLDFALAGLARHPGLPAALSASDLARMLASPDERVVLVAATEIERRFDPTAPDVRLLRALVEAPVETARDRGLDLARRSAPAWAGDRAALEALLGSDDAAARNALAEIAARALAAVPAAARAAIAEMALAWLRDAKDPDRSAAWSVVALGVADEIARSVSTVELLAWIDRGTVPAKLVAGHLLAARPGALEILGVGRLIALANDPVVAVRAAAHALLRGLTGALRTAPGPLFELAESSWDDTRAIALAMLKDEVDLVGMGLDAIVALADSNRDDVQGVARDLIVRAFDRVDPEALLARLSEHPRAPMRAFAIELIEKHLRPGLVPLARLEDYFRACILDTRPRAETKRRVIDFLGARGLGDEGQAAVAARVLAAALRTRTKTDFDRIVAAIARIQTAYPAVQTDLHLAAYAQEKA